MRAAAAALTVTALLLAGCTSGADEPAPEPTGDVDEGYSTPVEDEVYPDVGDPGIDALHYDLTLTWDPDAERLDGVETLTFRATADADEFQLDLGEPLVVGAVTVDGTDTTFEHDGKDLIVEHPVEENGEYTASLSYSGTPAPVRAPVQRGDFSHTGWTVVPGGGVWTMQEPFGAYSWYAVNDQPSDKALYDITLRVPPPMVGVANGELRSRETVDGLSVSRWHLDEPAASYLVTVALGDFEETTDTSPSGVPISYWVPRGRADLVERLRAAPAGLAWLEERLGPYPFDRLGFVVVPSRSGMETQTMITLGDTAYATAPAVIVHELAHHWYGDTVTPLDWRDVWMNEGMATFLQGAWMAEHGPKSMHRLFAEWAALDVGLRAQYGPPADYRPDAFASGNVYYIPAVMWNELRRRIGDEEFWRLVREWPESNENGNATYDDITGWWSEQTGEDLTGFFETWLRAEDSPRE
ncbi:M1 family metallopeptidase [Nocardioides pyridinolyticus]